MFEDDDVALVESISVCARAEAAAAGARLTAIAELATRRLGTDLARSRERWAADAWDSCAAEVGAELTIGHRAASALMHQGLDLRHRFPLVGELLREGLIPLRVATTVTWRGRLIDDDEIAARVDADIASVATRFGRLSEIKLRDAIDDRIAHRDPDAVSRFRGAEGTLDVRFGKPDDETGTVSVFGRVKIGDAELHNRLADALARSVCPDDPRTLGERRAEAFGVIAVKGEVLPCRCGNADCPAPAGPDARRDHIVIHVVTNDPDGPEDTAPPAVPCAATTVIAGGGFVPAPLLAELRSLGAAVRPMLSPHELCAETGYRPSTALQRLVRTRDMTCCFPGCDHPAEFCDLDHTIPYETGGPTHPGNLKCVCRKHHLLKTFWVGQGGWTDEQLADGTIVWTTPAGLRKYVPPGSRVLFPHWDTSTPAPPSPPRDSRPGRELAMPQRKRTRARQHHVGVAAERARNRRTAEQNPPPF